MPLYLQPYRKYFNFRGRASRREFWGFYTFQILVSCALFVAILLAGGRSLIGNLLSDGGPMQPVPHMAIFVLSIIVLLAFAAFSLIPNYSAMTRRLHDRGTSAWLLLLNFVPFVGPVALLVLLALAGDVGANRYGAPTEDKSESYTKQ